MTDHIARDVNPRFSPDGRWIAYSSARFGNYDVFVMPAAGGAPRRLTFHTADEEVMGWSPDSKNLVFRASRGNGVFPSVATLFQVPAEGGPEIALPVDWGWWGSYSSDGKQFVFNRHPPVWSRKHYRGSYSADIWIADLTAKTSRQILGGENYHRMWPMWGPKDEIFFAGDPLPNEKNLKPGSPEVRKSVRNIYRIPAKGGTPVQVTKHTDGNLNFPSISSDGKVIVYEANFGLWKLDVASGKTVEVKIDIATDEKENQVEIATISNEADSFDLSPSGKRAVISSRNQLFTIATDRGDITVIANDKGASRNESPQWSPDGKSIAFLSDRSGRQEVYLVDQDGKNPRKISDLDSDKGQVVWSPDSKALAFASTDKKIYYYCSGGWQDGGDHFRAPFRLRVPPHFPRTGNGSPSSVRTQPCGAMSILFPSPEARNAISARIRWLSARAARCGLPTASSSSIPLRQVRAAELLPPAAVRRCRCS